MSYSIETYRAAAEAVYTAEVKLLEARLAVQRVLNRIAELGRINHQVLALADSEGAYALHAQVQPSLRSLRDRELANLRSSITAVVEADQQLAPLLDQLIDVEGESYDESEE